MSRTTQRLRPILAIVAIISVSLLSCQKSINSIPTSEAEIATSANNQSNQAAPVRSVTIIPAAGMSFPVPINCVNGGLGEVLLLQEGNLMITSLVIVNGNHYNATFQFHPMGITAVGATTGTLYHSAGGEEFHSTGSFTNGQSTDQVNDRFYWIGEGPDGAKFKFNIRYNLVTNADGTVTASVDKIYSTCQ